MDAEVRHAELESPALESRGLVAVALRRDTCSCPLGASEGGRPA
jgi:hypothetical protein